VIEVAQQRAGLARNLFSCSYKIVHTVDSSESPALRDFRCGAVPGRLIP
jgi:hypothetical protein